MTITPSRGEVWYVKFDPKFREEIGKTRPAVVVSVHEVGRLPLHIVVPLTNWSNGYQHYPWIVYVPATPENGLTKNSGADAFQVKSVARARFVDRIGSLLEDQMASITAAIMICVGA